MTFIRDSGGVHNIWRLPIAGGPQTRITDFKSGTIQEYEWSIDGKQLIFTRDETHSDVVLITNFRCLAANELYPNSTQQYGNRGHRWNRWTRKKAPSRNSLGTAPF